MTLTEFLLPRIAEDKAAAKTRFVSRRMIGGEMREIPVPLARGAWAWSPARVLAECEAKRRIVELHHDRTPADIIAERLEDGEPWTAECAECSCYGDCRVPLPCPTLRLLALPYADHPDYRQEWRPRPARLT